MFKKILIANRGEIALRIIRCCQELGIKTVAIYSEVDRESLHVKYADEAFCVGPAPAKDSYLNLANIMSTAELLGVDAIHPGYGFLSEDANFAEICQQCGIKFIGPDADALRKLGDKRQARQIAEEAKVKVLPGTTQTISEENEAYRIAQDIGYPLIIKAANGGGGKGQRVVKERVELAKAIGDALGEMKQSQGINEFYLEKYLENPRHIEVQILSDNYGDIIYLPERDCSLQRRNQKILEESPAVGISENLRRILGEAAIKIAKIAKYTNLGTVEFLIDGKKNYYFLEVNPRIQVEHSVSEIVTGVDLIKQQILLAAGERLNIKQHQTKPRGHALEVRICAEDEDLNFLPQVGTINTLHLPGGPGVRVDTHLYPGYQVTPYYDSLLIKLITWGRDRGETISRMKRALYEMEIEGVKSTQHFFLQLLTNQEFIKGKINTNFITAFLEERRLI